MVLAQGVVTTFVNQDPDPVRAGDVVEVRFKVENFWEDTRDEVAVEILPEYPFSLYSGVQKKNLGRLTGSQFGGDEIIVDFKLLVDQKASDGDHVLKVKMYQGETEWIYDEQFFVDVENEKVKLVPYIVSSDIVTAGSAGKVSIEIANAGGYDVEALELELTASADYKLLSTSNYVYLGNLDADDTESEDFSVFVSEEVKQVRMPVLLRYEVNDYQYEDKTELVLNLLSMDEAKKIGLVKKSSWPIIAVIIVLGLLAILAIRKFRKR